MFVLHFSAGFLLTASLRRRRISVYNSLFTVTIPVNYTSDFGELFETTGCEKTYCFAPCYMYFGTCFISGTNKRAK